MHLPVLSINVRFVGVCVFAAVSGAWLAVCWQLFCLCFGAVMWCAGVPGMVIFPIPMGFLPGRAADIDVP